MCFTFKIEPKNVTEALGNEFWVTIMQKELVQFERNKVWKLAPRPGSVNVIDTNYKNNSDELGQVTCNKVRLVAQGYTQVEGIDYEETLLLLPYSKPFIC